MQLRYALLVLFSLWGFTLQSQSEEYIVEKLTSNVNTKLYDEISPVLSRDGKFMFFTRVAYPIYEKTLIENGQDLSKTLSKAEYRAKLQEIFSTVANQDIYYPDQSKFNQDIWMARLGDGDFAQVSHPGFPLNNALPNSVCAVSYDGNSVILINQFLSEGGMKKGFSISSKLPGGGWSFPKPLYLHEYYNNDPDVSLTMDTYENVMILSMDRNDSFGKNDLYVSLRTGPYSWSSPINLGSIINSDGRETTPYLSTDNRTLYFSSNRSGTMGGSDIFIAKRLGDGWQDWTAPRPVKSPMNSPFDDSHPVFDFSSGYLYFTSKRDGSSDIFRVSIAPPVSEKVTVKGNILDGKSKEKIDASVFAGVGNPDNYKETYISKDGTFNIKVPKGITYNIIAKKPGFIGQAESISFKENYAYFKEYEINLTLNPIESGTKIHIKPIYFAQSKALILEKSYPHLDELADFLNKNKNLYIRIEGHTDNQGNKEDLLLLSEQRAESIKEYLVYKKGIHPVRIETVGLGASQPVNDNSTDNLRQENRRVEVVVTNVSKILSSRQFPSIE